MTPTKQPGDEFSQFSQSDVIKVEKPSLEVFVAWVAISMLMMSFWIGLTLWIFLR